MSEDGLNNGAPAEQAPSPDSSQAAEAEALRREAEENWNKYLRAVAELDNFRKRTARDIEAARVAGAARLAQGLLPVRDSLEAGLAASDVADPATLIQGLQATL